MRVNELETLPVSQRGFIGFWEVDPPRRTAETELFADLCLGGSLDLPILN